MRELYDAGGTLSEVAERFGISRERVRQLFRAHGLPTRSIAETAALRREQLLNEHREQILQLIDAGAAPNEIAERLGISPQLVYDALRDDPDRRRLAAFRRTAKTRPKPKYSDEEIIECLRSASVELGGVLTTADYTKYARTRQFSDGRLWPLHQTAFLRFGSWRGALQRAGLEANPPSAIAGQRLFTREHCIDAILEVERELGHPPTAAEYERAATTSNGILPSLATVRHRCGGWQEALVLAARFSQ
jgi:DNA-binding CsgD family transcriptional regulator